MFSYTFNELSRRKLKTHSFIFFKKIIIDFTNCHKNRIELEGCGGRGGNWVWYKHKINIQKFFLSCIVVDLIKPCNYKSIHVNRSD